MKPYCAIYSTFLQRAYDQIIHDIAIAELPVTLCVDRGGFVGADGSTHHGIYDIAYLKTIPNLNIMLPKDRYELEAMLDLSYELDKPVVIRYARGSVYDNKELPFNNVELGKPEIISDKGKIAVISVGHIFSEVYTAYKKLQDEGIDVTLINLRFVKPLNKEYLLSILKDKSFVIIIEEGALIGGAGEMIISLLNNSGIYIPSRSIGIDDEFFEHGTVADLRKDAGLDWESLYNTIKDCAYKA